MNRISCNILDMYENLLKLKVIDEKEKDEIILLPRKENYFLFHTM